MIKRIVTLHNGCQALLLMIECLATNYDYFCFFGSLFLFFIFISFGTCERGGMGWENGNRKIGTTAQISLEIIFLVKYRDCIENPEFHIKKSEIHVNHKKAVSASFLFFSFPSQKKKIRQDQKST